MTSLLDPLTLRGVTFANRIGVSPMCQYVSVDGFPSAWHQVHLGSRAAGRNGLVMTEATAVSPEGRITPGCLGIWDDEHAERLRPIADFIAANGSVPGIQLAHAGRKASTRPPSEGGTPLAEADGGWPVIGPSEVPFAPDHPKPLAMEQSSIATVAAQFVAAAVRAVAVGFTVLEIHAAHGYLIHSFLSPLSNLRTDEYGRDFAGRTRLLLDIVEQVRAAVPDAIVLFVRLSASDWVDGGWSIEDTVALARQLRERGVDVVDCSSGGLVPGVSIPTAPGYQVPFAERVRRDAAIPTAAVGLITEPRQADEIIRSGRADLVLMGRASLRDPYFPIRAARELEVTEAVRVPLQYERAW